MRFKRSPAFARKSREVAAKIWGIHQDSVHIELEELNLSSDGRPSVLINWSQSMKYPEKRHAVQEAVRMALPEKYKDYIVTVV
jgi:hypothetical protein